jgi:hypothetical protein
MLADPDHPVAGVVVANPSFLGLLEPMAEIGRLAHAAGALFVSVVEPVSLAVLATPGEYGADIAAGDGQPLGMPLSYGGPYLGILACREALVRQIPGRLVGMTTDIDGKRAFVMTLRAREQDIRREKASSNICTNQALCALAASIYLAAIGPHGLRDVAALGAARAAELEVALAAAGAPRLHPGRTSTSSPSVPMRRRPCPPHRPRHPGRPAAGAPRAGTTRRSPTRSSCAPPKSPLRPRSRRLPRLSVRSSADRRSPDDTHRRSPRPHAVRALASGPRRRQGAAPAQGRPGPHPRGLARGAGTGATARLPEVSEPELARHYVNLSQLNYSVDTGFYPLGSCTMKYNPKINEWAARLPGFAALHPLASQTSWPRARCSSSGSSSRRWPRSAA